MAGSKQLAVRTPPRIATRRIEEPVGDAEIAALLVFQPVTRQVKRPDGWTPERQRQFIRLLAETGSPQQAAAAMGKVLSGVEALYKQEGTESFRAAWDGALELAAARERAAMKGRTRDAPVLPPHRRRANTADKARVAEEAECEPEDESSFEEKQSLFERLAGKYLRKVEQERDARLNGEIVAADFYVRQITAVEVMLDLICDGHGSGAFEQLAQLRRKGRSLYDIADTPVSRLLDDARRAFWADCGEPMRPEHPPERYARDHGSFRTQEHAPSGSGDEDVATRERIKAERIAADAKAQVEWEAE
ncbi:MAG: hypothetical protein ABIO43_13410, partial [Sphingomicrobium sp.]